MWRGTQGGLGVGSQTEVYTQGHSTTFQDDVTRESSVKLPLKKSSHPFPKTQSWKHTCYMSIKKLFKTKRACHSSGIPALGLSYLWNVRPSFSCKKTLDFLEKDVGVFSLYPRIIMEGEVPQSHKFFLSCSLSMLLFYLWTVWGDVGWGLGMILL